MEHIVSLGDEPGRLGSFQAFMDANWTPIGLMDDVGHTHWMDVMSRHPTCQFGVYRGGDLVALGNCAPVYDAKPLGALPDGGWQWALKSSLEGQPQDKPAYICALAATVHQDMRGQRLSTIVLKHFKAIARQSGAQALIAPVRPVLKHCYPLIPMEDYIQWTRPNGAPFDPWLNTHAQIGGQILHVSHKAMSIERSVSFWEDFTGHRMPSSGQYLVPGALNPIAVDIAQDIGAYHEPNVWVLHAL